MSSRDSLSPEDLKHFGLPADPFDDGEDPETIWMSTRLGLVEAAMKSAITRRQIMTVTAPTGSGKSTLVRRLAAGIQIRQKTVRAITVATLDRSAITHTTLAVAILRDLTGRHTSSMSGEERGVLLRDTLQNEVAAGHYPVILLDEAHHLKPKALLALKQVWDSHVLFKQLAVILAGQPPLAGMLTSDPALRELYGRTRMLEVPALTAPETADYIRWRFTRVGADADKVFDPGAWAALATRGERPMWINNLATAAIIYAAERRQRLVTAEMVLRT